MNVKILNHPLVKHKCTLLRDKHTKPQQFRELMRELSILMAYELTRDLNLEEKVVDTPLAPFRGKKVREDVVLLPVFRAGLGMTEGFLTVMPTAKTGHVGIYRDEDTIEPVFYYCKLPDLSIAQVIILDPMLATGGTATYCVNMLKQNGCSIIKLAALISAVPGVERLNRDHPDVEIFTCDLDPVLNEKAYIVPGLGDAGDRQFST